MRLKLTLEYDGTGFRGWARQPGLRTVEESVRIALDAIFPSWSGLAVAGRTDAGVHATGQVASIDAEGGPAVGERRRGAEHRAPGGRGRSRRRGRGEGLPCPLLRAVALLSLPRADATLHSPLHARRALWWPRAVDADALVAAAALLPGEHDFRAFTPTETQHDVFHRNVLAAAWEDDGGDLDFVITADSFLRHMVRTLAGTMLELGPEAPARIEELLQGRPRDDAGLTAPPWGLYLERVEY